MTRLLLFIPFFNCEKQLPRVIHSLIEYKQLFSHILFIDNRSTDNGLEVVKDLIQSHGLKDTTLIKNHENINLGGSHKVAFRYALENDYTHLLVLHGDDQASLKDIYPQITQLDHWDGDCFLGSRFSQGSQLVGYSRFRTLGNHILNLFCTLTCKIRIEDMGAGLNLYNCKIFKDDRIWSFPNNLTFNVYLLFHSCFKSQKVAFFPISWREEDQVSNAKVFKQMFVIFKIIFLTFVNRDNLYQNSNMEDYTYDIVFP